MNEIIVTTQKELDKIKPDFDGTIYIEGGTWDDPLVYIADFKEATVISRGKAFMILKGDAKLYQMRGSSTVAEMWESSTVAEMWESSTVAEMRESSTVRQMRESSTVRQMWESSTVAEMWESSTVAEMRESSTVRQMWGSSTVALYGESMVSAYSAALIECHGYNVVRIMDGRKNDVNVVVNKDSHVIVIPKRKMDNFDDYSKYYPVETKGKTVTMYKMVRKNGTEYFSDYNHDFTYIIGEVKKEICDPKENGSCSAGIHISHKSWALGYGAHWNNGALLECEVKIKDIIISADTDGKVRTSELKVIREVPQSEWYA